jgi:hypothetical protein
MRDRKPLPCLVTLTASVVELGVVADLNAKVRKDRPRASDAGCDILKRSIADSLDLQAMR